jgi:hypothetical protein
MANKILITWDTNWADEMDIAGFKIVTETEANEFKEKLKNNKDWFTICIGTNEDIEYGSGKDLLSELKFKKITEEEEIIIKKFFGDSFGHTDFMRVDEWDDDDYDEED